MIDKWTTELTNFKNSQAKNKMNTETQGAKLAHKLPFAPEILCKSIWPWASSAQIRLLRAETDSVATKAV